MKQRCVQYFRDMQDEAKHNTYEALSFEKASVVFKDVDALSIFDDNMVRTVGRLIIMKELTKIHEGLDSHYAVTTKPCYFVKCTESLLKIYINALMVRYGVEEEELDDVCNQAEKFMCDLLVSINTLGAVLHSLHHTRQAIF